MGNSCKVKNLEALVTIPSVTGEKAKIADYVFGKCASYGHEVIPFRAGQTFLPWLGFCGLSA